MAANFAKLPEPAGPEGRPPVKPPRRPRRGYAVAPGPFGCPAARWTHSRLVIPKCEFPVAGLERCAANPAC